MKKLGRILIVLGVVSLFSSQAFADNIGFIDLEKVFQKAKMVQSFEKNIKKKREDYEKEFKKNQEQLAKLQDEKTKAKTEKDKAKAEKAIEEFIKKVETDLKPKQEEIAQLEGGFQQTLLFTVTSTAEKVAKSYGIDVVMDKRAIFHGGFDLTDYVIEKINSAE